MIELTIDTECIKCGRCVAVCPARILTQEEQKGDIGVVKLQTCIECGQCVAICPTDSVQHSLFPPETVHEIDKAILPSPDALMEIMRRRRSNRAFSDKPVPMELLDKILEAANLAPTAKNAQPLEYTLVTNPKILEAVHKATIEVCEKLAEQLKDAEDKNMRMRAAFFHALAARYRSGYEVILRNAKAIILIHSKDETAVADANLAYQNASLMAEALGVAHFYTGYVRIFSMFDTEGIIRQTMGIEGTIHAGMALAMPKYTFNKYVDRKKQVVNRLV